MREFYAHKHRDSLDRLIVTRDICQQRVSDIEAEVPPAQMRQRAYARARARARAHTHTHTHTQVRSAEMRQSVVEEATRLQVYTPRVFALTRQES